VKEREASLFVMISDRHVYGDSGASEVCRERAGMSLLICRALNASLFEWRGRKPLYSGWSLTGTSTAAVGPQRYVQKELAGVSIDFWKASIAFLYEGKRGGPLYSRWSLTDTSAATIGPQRYVKRELRRVSIDFGKRASPLCSRRRETSTAAVGSRKYLKEGAERRLCWFRRVLIASLLEEGRERPLFLDTCRSTVTVGPQRYVKERDGKRLYLFWRVGIASLLDGERKASLLDIISDRHD
jgi:hypothetical protein